MATKRRLRGAAVLLPTAALGLYGATAHAQSTTTRGTAANLFVLSPLNGEVIGIGEFKLDVRFESRTSSPITIAELWIDGEKWVRRDLDAPALKNVLTFLIDGSTLKPGTHAVSVRVYSRDGAWSSTDLQIVADAGNKAPTGPVNPVTPNVAPTRAAAPEVYFRALPSKKLMGAIEIAVDVKDASGTNPYVSFYVDKQFKTLKNFPPYSFVFDTTTVSNGYHVIEALAYQESTNVTTTQRIQVLVDNPGGNTERAAEPVAPTAVKAPSAPTVTKAPNASAARLSTSPLALAGSVRELAALRPAPVPATQSGALVLSAPTSAVKPVAKAMRVSPSAPLPMAAGLREVPLPTVSVAAAKPVAVVPQSEVRAARPTASMSAAHAVPMIKKSSAPNVAAPRATINSLELPSAKGALLVAFNGAAITFDVQPRVENGLPLAPFRQIFEHTGGAVQWVGKTRTVRAVNADREVIFSVGSTSAMVNGTKVPFKRNSYIDRGRTIVPLSFVGDALDVDVQYDSVTGRLQINSKK